MAGQADSLKSILFALFANASIAVAKGVAALLTGSGAMLAESIHSVADAGNQLLLILGLRQTKKTPTEDHPLEYADFEGVIPQDEYGGGVMIVWDKGTYRNLQADKDDSRSMAESYEDGHIEIWLEGEKLSGGYALIRTGKGDDSRWLLIKMKDDRADARRNPTSTEPKSVLSGRTLEEVREQAADEGSEES